MGHLCEPGLGDNEGGNVIFEYIYFDTELQAAFGLCDAQGNNCEDTVTRVMAYYLNSHVNPKAVDGTGAPAPQKTVFPNPGECNNLVDTNGWPLFVAQDRTDVDIGTMTITGKNTAGGDSSIAVPKLPAGNDSIGRPHDIFYQTIVPDAPSQQKPDTAYNVQFSGAGDIPATTYDDAIYLAGDFTVKDPDIEGNGPLIAGTDFPVAWNPGTTSVDDTVLGVTWLVDAAGSPTHMCPTLHSAGTFTIPGQAIAEYKAIAEARGTPTNKMILLRNAIVHRLDRLPNGEDDNPRRIDMLSVLCWAQLMDVQ